MVNLQRFRARIRSYQARCITSSDIATTSNVNAVKVVAKKLAICKRDAFQWIYRLKIPRCRARLDTSRCILLEQMKLRSLKWVLIKTGIGKLRATLRRLITNAAQVPRRNVSVPTISALTVVHLLLELHWAHLLLLV